MNRKMFLLFVLLMGVVPSVFGQVVTREQIESNSRGRYEPPAVLEQVPASQVYNQPAFTGDLALLNGYGKKTAEELGLTGLEVWNEYPLRCDLAAEVGSRAVKVVLDPRAEIFYDTASMEPLYINGCICANKAWINRIKLVAPYIPPPPEVILTPLPPYVPPPSPVVIPVGPPSCIITGNEKEGFLVSTNNGTGAWTLTKDGIVVFQGERLEIPPTSGPGSYLVTYKITGVNGEASCAYPWEVPVPPPTFVMEVEEEGISWCDGRTDHRWFAWPLVQIRCHPIRTALIVGTCLATAKLGVPPCGKGGDKETPPIKIPKVENKPVPPGGVLTPP